MTDLGDMPSSRLLLRLLPWSCFGPTDMSCHLFRAGRTDCPALQLHSFRLWF
jgi:hypothetical protein